MNILIVIPKFIRRVNEYYDMPLGLAYIATVLKKAGYNVSAVNMNTHVDRDEFDVLSQHLKEHKVDAVLSGGLSAFFNSIEKIFLAIRKIDPSITTVLGGGIVSSDKETICQEIKPDFAVIGEAEVTIEELIGALQKGESVENVFGIGYPKEGTYVFTPPRPAIDDLDTIPNPDYEIFNLDDYFERQSPLCHTHLWPLDNPRVLPIVTSRSCPLDCTFCFHPVGKKYRARDLDLVFEEIEDMIEKYDINIVAVLDELMSASKKRMLEFAKRIKKYDLLWGCQLWPGTVDDETIKVMKDSGCYLVSYGLESISDDVLMSMKKFGVTRKKIEASLKQAKDHKITIQGNFIFGDPAETIETSNATLEWWKQNPEYKINLGKIAPYPGTPLYDYALQEGIIRDRAEFIRAGTPSVNMTQMNADEYAEMLSKIARYSAEGRQYAKVISVERDPNTEYESYCCDVECPHCHEVVSYGNMIVQKAEILRIGCRSCFLRFDIKSSVFPNLARQLKVQRERILELHEKHGSLVISPAIMEDRFIEYFELLDLDYKTLNISGIIDSNDSRVGKKYLDDYSIYKRDEEGMNAHDNPGVVVMVSLYRDEIIQKFLELGIPKEGVFSVEEKPKEQIDSLVITH